MVRIAYRDGTGAPSERQVRPLVIWNLTDGWMVSAWCELRRDFRTFRLDRIAALSVLETRFEDDDATGLRAFMAQEACGAEAP